jgi:hypothetical protein
MRPVLATAGWFIFTPVAVNLLGHVLYAPSGRLVGQSLGMILFFFGPL